MLVFGVEFCLGWERELDRFFLNWSYVVFRSCYGFRGSAGKVVCYFYVTRNGIFSVEGVELVRSLCLYSVSFVCFEGGRVGGG